MKSTRVVVERGCDCEDYPFCEHVPSAATKPATNCDHDFILTADDTRHCRKCGEIR